MSETFGGTKSKVRREVGCWSMVVIPKKVRGEWAGLASRIKSEWKEAMMLFKDSLGN